MSAYDLNDADFGRIEALLNEAVKEAKKKNYPSLKAYQRTLDKVQRINGTGKYTNVHQEVQEWRGISVGDRVQVEFLPQYKGTVKRIHRLGKRYPFQFDVEWDEGAEYQFTTYLKDIRRVKTIKRIVGRAAHTVEI